jgi:probable F420-dependent oxidoreductase
MKPRRSVVLGYWQDRPSVEAFDTARLADQLGFGELWIGEMATFDAFALATAIGRETKRLELTIGPLAVSVRTPVGIAMGAASVAALTARQVHVAIGTSSAIVVEDWHGRRRERTAKQLAETAAALRPLLAGERAEMEGEMVRTKGYRLRLDPPRCSLTIAGLGRRAVEVAARYADRAVLNLVTPETTASIRRALAQGAERAGRKPPRLAVWLAAAVDPMPQTIEQIRRALVSYLAAPGYGEMFAAAGFADVVALARSRPHPSDLLEATPARLCEAVGLIGDKATVESRIAEYAAAGADEVCLVPATAGDPGGERTLSALAPAPRAVD